MIAKTYIVDTTEQFTLLNIPNVYDAIVFRTYEYEDGRTKCEVDCAVTGFFDDISAIVFSYSTEESSFKKAIQKSILAILDNVRYRFKDIDSVNAKCTMRDIVASKLN